MISWKHSFRELNGEYETARKKRQALDCLLDTGKISQSTHDLFSTEIAEAITDIERRQKALLQKMNAKMVELEEQTKTLEILLANFEIQHVTGEIDEETYQREINVLSMGLETSREELDSMKDAANQLSNANAAQQKDEPQLARDDPAPKKLQETVMEFVQVSGTSSSETKEETAEAHEESQPVDTKPEGEDKQTA